MAEGKLGISVILENDAKRVFNLLNKNLDEVNKKTELTITAKSEKAVKAIDAMLGGVLGDAGVGSLVKPIMQMSTTTKEFERNIAELKNIMAATRRYVSTDFLLGDFKELTNKQKFSFMQAIYQNRKKITEVESKDELGNTIITNKKVDRNKTEMANYLIQDNVTIKQLLDSFNGTIKNAFIKSLTNQLAKSKNDVSQRYQNAIQSALSFKDINETIKTINIKEFDDSLSKLIMPIDQLLLTLKKLDELKRKADTASSIDISEKYLEEIDKLIGAENAMGDYRARIKHVISSLIGTDKTNAIFNNLYGQKVNENIGLIDDDEDDIKFAKSVKDYVLSVTDPAKFKKKQAIKTLEQKATKETQAKEQQEEIHNQELMQKALEETSKKYADISDQVKKYAVSLDEAFEAANRLFEASGNGANALLSKDERDFFGFYQRYLSMAGEENVDKIDPIYKMYEKRKMGRNKDIALNVDVFTAAQLEVYSKLKNEISSVNTELSNTEQKMSSITQYEQSILDMQSKIRKTASYSGMEETLWTMTNGAINEKDNEFGKNQLVYEYGRPTVDKNNPSRRKLRPLKGVETLAHTHPVLPDFDNLRFSWGDLRDKAVAAAQEALLLCGEEVLSLRFDPNKFTSEIEMEWYSVLNAIFARFGAVIKETGGVIVNDLMTNEQRNSVSQMWNSYLSDQVKKLGGSVTTYKTVNGRLKNTTSSRIGTVSDDDMKILKEFSDLLINEEDDKELRKKYIALQKKHGIEVNPFSYADDKTIDAARKAKGSGNIKEYNNLLANANKLIEQQAKAKEKVVMKTQEETRAIQENVEAERNYSNLTDKELDEKIDHAKKAIENQKHWVRYTNNFLIDENKKLGKKEATDKLRSAHEKLRMYNKNPDGYGSDFKTDVHATWMKAWIQAKNAGVAQKTLDTYDTDLRHGEGQAALKVKQKENAEHSRFLKFNEEVLMSLQQEKALRTQIQKAEKQVKEEVSSTTSEIEKQNETAKKTVHTVKELEKAVHAIQIAKKNVNKMPQSEVDASIDAIYKEYPELQPLQKHIDKLGMNNTARIRFYKTPQWRKMINGLNVSDTINANTQESNANEQAAISAKQHVSANNQLVESEQEVASAVNNTNNILEKRSQITQFQPPMSLDSSDRVKSQIVDYMNRQTDVRNFMSNLYQQVLNGVFGTISSNTPVNVSTKFQPPMDMSYFNNAQSLIADFVKRQGDIRNFVTNMYQQVLDSAFAMMTYKIPTAQTQKSNQASQSSETAISNMISANEKLAVSAEQAAASVEHEANVVDKLNGSQNNGFELIGESYSTDFVILDDSTSQNGNKYKNRKLKGGKLTGKKYIANDSFDGQSIDEAIKKEAELQAAVNNVTEAQQKQGEVGKTVVKNNQKNSETKKSSTESESKKIKQNTEEAKNKAKEAKALYEELANLERQHQKDLKQQTRDDNLGSDYRSQEVSDRINDYDNKLSKAKQLTEEFKKVNVSDKSEEWTQLNKSIEQYEKNLETINNKNKNNLERRVESYGSSFDKVVERLSSKDGLSSKYSDKYIETKIQEGKKYQKQLSDFSAEWLSNLDTKSPNFSHDLERAALEFDELQKKVNKFKSECKNLFDFRSTSTGIEQIKKLENEIDKLLGYSKISSDHKTELSVLKNRLSGDITESDFTTIKSRVSDINKEMQKFGEKGASFIDKVKGRFQSLGAYLITFVSFYQVANVIRKITNSVKEFDDALTEMRKVSNESVDTLKDYQKQSFDMAKSIGTDALSLQNSTADFMRLGQTLEEAKDSAMSANVLMNVSEFESIDQATDSLIAMKSAYKDLDNMQIIDKLNEVGNNMPIATAGLATALQDSASALTTANNSIDESIALITAGRLLPEYIEIYI